MRIIHVACVAPPEGGGIGVVADQEVRWLRALGVDATLVAPITTQNAKRTTHDEHESISDAGHVIRLPAWRIGNVAWLKGLGAVVKDADIVHLHYPFYFTAGRLARWRRQHKIRRLVITLHHDAMDTGWRGWVADQHRRFLQKRVLDSADRLIVSTLDYARHSSFAPWADDTRTRELAFGVDTATFRPTNDEERKTNIDSGTNGRYAVQRTFDIRNSVFGLPDGVKVIGTVSVMDRAHPFKGIDVLLRAAVLLPIDVHVLLIGEGDRRTEYEHQAQELGLGDRVHFVGRLEQSRLVQALQAMDVFVLPSINRAEAFGLVVLEAMACGVPVVVSDLPGVRSVAQGAGLVVPINDPIALAQSLRRLLLDEISLGLLSTKARDKALTLSWDVHARKLAKDYRDLCA
jgi:glycosyltransferase involved in cell wall biosynthesis